MREDDQQRYYKQSTEGLCPVNYQVNLCYQVSIWQSYYSF